MKKKLLFVLALSACLSVHAQDKRPAEWLSKEALKQESVLDSIEWLRKNLSRCETSADTRSLLYFTASLLEQVGLYTEAAQTYARAASVAGGDARNMKRVTTEQIVIDAVRSSLCAGDWETADSYLNSSVRSSKNENIRAWANLYSVWSALCRASSVDDTADSVALLTAYSSMQSMKCVRPQILFTLWYLTGGKTYSDILVRDYPNSPEAAVASGRVQIMSVPFWYFVPRSQNISVPVPSAQPEKPAPAKTEAASAPKPSSSIERPKSSVKKQQLGLYKSRDNALELAERVRKAGFDAYFFSETRPSGNVYFIVVVDDVNANGTLATRLKNAGFDCYTIN